MNNAELFVGRSAELFTERYPVDYNVIHTSVDFFTGRQYPVDANVIHTLGQLTATVGPIFLLQTLGLASLLIGVLLISLVTYSFAPMRTDTDNLGFGFITGGVFSAITNNYDSRLANSAITAANSGLNSGQGLSTGQSSGGAGAGAPAVADTVRMFFYFFYIELLLS